MVLGEEAENTLAIFDAFQEQSSTASRATKPLSKTAENITVITSAEIKALNAHTLADVLATIPGVQADPRGAVGHFVFTLIQSSYNRHILVLLDGVPLNTLGENFSDTSLVPAQIIERIEIVKGAASSSWGQALGGVINVITKAPERGRVFGGSVGASIGDRTTADTRAEVGGTSGRLGYYLSGGFLGTKGLTPNTGPPSSVSSNGIYSKLTWDLPDHGNLWTTFKFDRADRSFGTYLLDYKEDNSLHNISASLGLRKQLSGQLELELLGRYVSRDQDSFTSLISDNTTLQNIYSRERVGGVSAKLVWRGNDNLLVVGGDYEHAEAKTTDTRIQLDTLDRKADRWGVYLNDTATFGTISVVPGARFDRTVSAGDQFSPSLGVVWQLNDKMLLRGYTARGFSVPYMLQDSQPEKIWTSQVGIESSTIPYLWLKGTLFRNETWNVRTIRNLDPAVAEPRMAMGTELEIRTTPVYHTSLAAGYTFTDSLHASDGSQVYADPRHTVQLALRYDDESYRGLLTGRHVYWNSVPGYGGRYGGLIWDLHLGAKLLKRENSSLELFFSGHNIFNGNQYSDETVPNARRWFDGGVRVNF